MSAPATPGPTAESSSAASLWWKVSMPIASAATSSSRIVISRSPKREVTISHDIAVTTTASTPMT